MLNKNNKITLYLGIIMCVYVIVVNLTLGKITFSKPFVFLGSCLIVYYFVNNKFYENKIYKKIIKAVNILILIGITIFTIVECAIVIFPKNNDSKSEYIIVLGAGVRGETPSLTLQARLEKALEYLEKHSKTKVVLSGGKGSGENISEAEAMRRFLIKNGVAEEYIIMEDKSTSTVENFKYSKKVIEEQAGVDVGELDIKVVTSDFHALRSSMIAKKVGYTGVEFYTSNTRKAIIPMMYTREFFAFVKFLILDKI